LAEKAGFRKTGSLSIDSGLSLRATADKAYFFPLREFIPFFEHSAS